MTSRSGLFGLAIVNTLPGGRRSTLPSDAVTVSPYLGFGSLDPRALEDAVAILRGLPEAHRMVGVISHVDELKKRVPVQLLVHAGARGSRLEVRMNA